MLFFLINSSVDESHQKVVKLIMKHKQPSKRNPLFYVAIFGYGPFAGDYWLKLDGGADQTFHFHKMPEMIKFLDLTSPDLQITETQKPNLKAPHIQPTNLSPHERRMVVQIYKFTS